MGELIGKRWFQVLGVIFLLVGFLAGSYLLRMKKPPKEESNVVADVCGTKITRLEYQTAISRRTTRIYYKMKMVRASDREKIHMVVFKELVNDKTLQRLAEKYNVTVTEADINKKIQKMKSQLDPRRVDELWQMYLSSMGYQSENDLRESLKYELIESKLTEKRFPHTKFEVDEKELYDNIPTIRLKQIFFVMNPEQPADTDINNSYAQAQARANEVYKLAMGGADFTKLAVQYSQDRNVAQTNGSLGFVSRNGVSPKFWDVVSTLQPGQITPPFKSEAGLHIVKCEEVLRPGDKKYDELKGLYKAGLILRKQKNAFAAWFAAELSKMEEEQNCVKIFDHELLANKYVFMGKYDKAIEEYRLAIKEDEDFPYYHIDIGQLLAKQGKKAEALVEFRKATEIAPMDGALYFRLGEVYMGYGEHEKALREFRKASDMSRLDYDLHLRLQTIYAQLGLLAEADEEHKRYLKAMQLLGASNSPAPETAPADDQFSEPEMPDYGAGQPEPPSELPLRAPGQR